MNARTDEALIEKLKSLPPQHAAQQAASREQWKYFIPCGSAIERWRTAPKRLGLNRSMQRLDRLLQPAQRQRKHPILDQLPRDLHRRRVIPPLLWLGIQPNMMR